MAPIQFAKDVQSNKIEKVAIVGASGQQGSAIVSELQKHSRFEITALTRANAGSKIPAGIKSIEVDYNNLDSLVGALQGQDVLIITLSVTAPPDTELKLIDAAAQAGVSWVFPNSWGMDRVDETFAKETVLGVARQKAHDHVESKNIKGGWIGMACSFWIEWSLSTNATHAFGIDISNKQALLFSGGNQKISTSTWMQPARALAALLSLPVYPQDANDKTLTLSHWRNRYVLIESFHVSQREMLDEVLKATGTSESEWNITSQPVDEVYAEGMKLFKAGDRAGFSKVLYSRCFYPDEQGNANFHNRATDLDNERLGLPEESFEEAVGRAVKMSQDGYIENFFAAKHK